jgi:hypothetical protein
MEYVDIVKEVGILNVDRFLDVTDVMQNFVTFP